MQKFLSYFIVISVIFCGLFLVFFPYPTFYCSTSQLSQNDISAINDKNEVENVDFRPPQTAKLTLLDWSIANNLFDYDKAAMAYDIDSGRQFCLIRISGQHHADVVPCDEESQNALSALFSQDNEKRAIAIRLCKNVWTIASLSKNKYNPHYCLYFCGSKSNSTLLRDRAQEKIIKKAVKTATSLPPFIYDSSTRYLS